MSCVLTRRLIAAMVMLLIGAAPGAAQQRQELRRDRPAALIPLYFTFAGLQAVDVHSTMSALDSGARESNPMMRGAIGSPGRMLLLKSSTAAGVVLITERIWPHNRTAAVISMIAINSAYATIAAHNYRAAGR